MPYRPPDDARSAHDDLAVDRLVAALREREQGDRAPSDAIRVVRAPGRINLIGEHTDYNEGLVLPAAIDLEVRIAYRPTDDGHATITLLASGETGSVALDDIPSRRGDWRDYLAGVAWALAKDGHPAHPFRGVLASTLPIASGLASSAALELACAWALSGRQAPALEGPGLAGLCQRAENDYVGVRCGPMDQYAVANGVADAALLLDCRSMRHRVVPLPDEIAIVVAHTGASRRLDASAYNERRAECERAVAGLAAHEPSIRSLRDVDWSLLERHRDKLDPVAYRRARHVVTEVARVEATAAALTSGDLAAIKELMASSHASLRDDFEVSSPELDALVEIAVGTPGVVGSRMTGAGFGGCTVTLARWDAAAALVARIEREYPTRTGLIPRVWLVRAADGAGVVGAGIPAATADSPTATT